MWKWSIQKEKYKKVKMTALMWIKKAFSLDRIDEGHVDSFI